jgi:hypothetical protein
VRSTGRLRTASTGTRRAGPLEALAEKIRADGGAECVTATVDLAAPDDVAEAALARLPHGPVHNWGQADDVVGYAPSSAQARRRRVELVTKHSRAVLGQ